ncbi:uncharacterized protein CG5098 [Anopheles aquasalis]|uniref:uncharacterized protein CG5098 n=1 Tax=Anopheles aquasalis TaxID=42839 RepID=UPI00215A83DF|nr:uncharacterized protein CG5098 [Anopheles aquasalis]
MSGHNPPHGRLGQPNTTWNPLQVPSYVPRQPQLAHMSSERSMARSPLTWHTPPSHQDKVYNLMTGSLMNNLESNPLLQGYNRGSNSSSVGAPLGTVDLSLSSASRSTPSPKGGHPSQSLASTVLPSSIPATGHPVELGAGDHTINNPARSTPTGSVIQSTIASTNSTTTNSSSSASAAAAAAVAVAAAIKERMQHGSFPSPLPSFNSTNNDGNGFGMSTGGGLAGRTAGNDLNTLMTGGLLIKDAKQINSEMESKNGRDCFSHLPATDSADLVKEFIMQTIQNSSSLSVSPKRNSPQRSALHSDYSPPNRSRSPPLNLGLLGQESLAALMNCTNMRLGADTKQPSSVEPTVEVNNGPQAAISASCAGNINPAASPTNNSITSNEDSVDSASGACSKSRRRRKPERTNKMNAMASVVAAAAGCGVLEGLDGQSFFNNLPDPTAKLVGGAATKAAPPTEGSMLVEPLRSSIAGRTDITALAIEGINALSKCLPSEPQTSGSITSINSSNSTASSMAELANRLNSVPSSGVHRDVPLLHHPHPNSHHHLLAGQTAPVSANLIQSNSNLNNSTSSSIKTVSPSNSAVTVTSLMGGHNTSIITTNTSASPSSITTNAASLLADGGLLSVTAATVAAAIDAVSKDMKSTAGGTDTASEECETLDKIAAMVSSVTAGGISSPEAGLGLSMPFSSTNGGTITTMAERKCSSNGPVSSHKSPPSATEGKVKCNDNARVNASDSSYEEVENKLEEMFAGIVEEKIGEPPLKQPIEPSISLHNNNGNNSNPGHNPTTNVAEPTDVTDGALLKQLSCENIQTAGVAGEENNREQKTHFSIDNSGTPLGSSAVPPAAAAATGSGKKPLTPAQKRANGTKETLGEQSFPATSTPVTAAAKRKRGPKKKAKTGGSPFFEPADKSGFMGLKALNMKGKKNGKPAAGPAGGKKKGGGKGGKQKGANSSKAANGPNERLSMGDRDTQASSMAGWPPGAIALDALSKHKGPYVQVKANGSHSVVNASTNDEDGEKPQTKLAKKLATSLNASERSKIRGLHVSTLSTKYDADTTDISWMCVFCKMGPHKFRLGDLFGPYIISTASDEYRASQVDVDYFSVKRSRDSLESTQARERRMAEQQKQQKQQAASGSGKGRKRKNAASGANNAQAAAVAPHCAAVLKEEKKDDDHGHLTHTDVFYGMMKASDSTYEVWTHEDCLVWAPGVYMVGTRVIGLEAAIWNCCRHRCQLCSQYGAVICCLRQGCTAKAHFICAHKQNWKLTDEYQAFCEAHAIDEPGSGLVGIATQLKKEIGPEQPVDGAGTSSSSAPMEVS